ncbi:MAG TPA: FG-GAP-like repeat-containing protein [Flavobacterium sp.]
MKLKLYSKIRRTLQVFLLLGFGVGSHQAFAQDACSSPLSITAGTYTVAAINGSNNSGGCSTASMAEWYAYTPTQNYSVTVSSDLPQNICKDTNFMVYTGTCGSFTCYAGDDDAGTIICSPGNGMSYLSKDTFDVLAGTTYYIVWDNRWTTAGFDFSLTQAPYVPSPCATATPVTAGITTVPAITGGNVTTSCSTASAAKWYSYTPTATYHVTITSDLPVNICKDTNFSVYTGSCSGTLTCVTSDDNSGVIACNSGNTNSNLSKKTFDVVAGTTYFIAWDNKWSSAGFDFQLTEEIIVVPVTYAVTPIPTINSSYNLCVVDMNGDSKDDIAGVSSNNLRIHYQSTGGAFTVSDFPISGSSMMPSWSLAAGDFNADGFNDLLLGSGSGLSFWKSNSTGTAYTSVTPGQYIFCQRTNFVDINADGHLDAFSCHDVDPNVYYLNNGDGNFTYYQSGTTPGAYSLGITPSGGNYASLWTDFDNDGDSDLFISKCSGPPCELHRNNGNGTFTDISALAQINVTPVQSWSSAVADFDNDGDMDILIGSNGSVNSMFFRNNLDTSNNVEEAFTNISLGSGWDTDETSNRDYIAYDFDNDGFVDVLSSSNRIMFNNGDGTFSPSNYPGLSVGAVGDLNRDGFLDILNNNTVRYAVPNGNNWMTVSLEGVDSNINGIGTRVEINGAWGKQIRDIRSGEGFEFMSTMNAHFGLGEADEIDSIIIKWPSGIVDTIEDPAINQVLHVVEGSTLARGEFASEVFSIYPNPVQDVMNIKLRTDSAEITSVEIFDLTGRLVLTPVLQEEAISVKNLAIGTYLLMLKTADGKQYTHKFIRK